MRMGANLFTLPLLWLLQLLIIAGLSLNFCLFAFLLNLGPLLNLGVASLNFYLPPLTNGVFPLPHFSGELPIKRIISIYSCSLPTALHNPLKYKVKSFSKVSEVIFSLPFNSKISNILSLYFWISSCIYLSK